METELGPTAMKVPKPTSMSDELARAARICARSKQALVSMFQEVRMGQTIRAEAAGELVDEISSSVLRNPGALISRPASNQITDSHRAGAGRARLPPLFLRTIPYNAIARIMARLQPPVRHPVEKQRDEEHCKEGRGEHAAHHPGADRMARTRTRPR